jgi:iron complex transport system ATP-binding protein
LARRQNLTAVLVLHQINLAAAVADVMVLLNGNGTTCSLGAPAQVMTTQNLQAVYETPLTVSLHPRSGRPQAQSNWVFEE